MRLVILEDNPLLAEYITGLVQKEGHEVVGCLADEATAVDLAIATMPDLLLADVDLGTGGSGIMAAVKIRETTGCKTLFMTGHSDAATRDLAQHAWPVGFITKPFDADQFVKILRSAISVLLLP